MHTITHAQVNEAVYRAVPELATRFMRLSTLELRYFAHLPDEVDGTNILVAGGCALDEAYGHSYKLAWTRDADTVTPITGSGPVGLSQVPRLARNAVREGDFHEARIQMARSLHIATDLTTIWHLTRTLTKKFHESGEAQIAKVAAKLLKTYTPTPVKMGHPKSLYLSLQTESEQTLRSQLDRVKAVQEAGAITETMPLVTEMVTHCADWSLTVLLYIWKVVDSAWK